ncbi:3'-phosphoesterase [Candidatus Woesearchaeota archaeon]|nr:3'-phosphoesterase [Candidatus Woesearchaeota archaeon]
MPKYVIQEHHASHHHWDFRLEMDGVLKSWAVPKEPPAVDGVKRLAVAVDDHDLSYAKFEGEIPEGQYGAGKVKIWDKGTYKMISKHDSKMVFEIKGKKLKGEYVLLKFTKAGPKNWLLFKKSED